MWNAAIFFSCGEGEGAHRRNMQKGCKGSLVSSDNLRKLFLIKDESKIYLKRVSSIFIV